MSVHGLGLGYVHVFDVRLHLLNPKPATLEPERARAHGKREEGDLLRAHHVGDETGKASVGHVQGKDSREQQRQVDVSPRLIACQIQRPCCQHGYECYTSG